MAARADAPIGKVHAICLLVHDSLTVQILSQNYTERDVFELSNDFYLSMGLDDMQMCFDPPCSNENTPENKVSVTSLEIQKDYRERQ